MVRNGLIFHSKLLLSMKINPLWCNLDILQYTSLEVVVLVSILLRCLSPYQKSNWLAKFGLSKNPETFLGKCMRAKKKSSPFILLAKHVLISYSQVFSISLSGMGLKVHKNSGIFRNCRVMRVGCGCALRASKILDFEFQHSNSGN